MVNPERMQAMERVYAFICDYLERYEQGPTQREIAASCGLSRYEVDRCLLYLRGARRLYERSTIPRPQPGSVPPTVERLPYPA